jgi:hypothetical protein
MIPQVLSLLSAEETPETLCLLTSLCSASTPAWVFLQWLPQLLSLVGGKLRAAVDASLEAVAKR